MLDSTESVAHRVAHLHYGVLVRAFQKKSTRKRVFHLLDKRKLVFAKDLLVHRASKAEVCLLQIIDRIHSHTAASQGEPLHVSPLRTPQCQDPGAREQVERLRVDPFLIDDHETFVCAVAQALLQRNDFADLVVGDRALRLDHLLALISRRVEKSRVHVALLVLERNIASQNVRVLYSLGHVRVAAAVIQHKTAHQARVGVRLMLHGLNFDHVEIDREAVTLDQQHGVSEHLCKMIGHVLDELRRERAPRDVHEQLAVDSALHLLPVEPLGEFALGNVESIGDHAWVQALRQVPLRLLEHFPDEQHGGRRAIAADVVLRRRGARDERRRRVLDLHLVQQHLAVLRQLDVSRARNEHLDRAFRPQVRAQHILQSLRGRDRRIQREPSA
mmetsp:Transcript_11307/g.30456  ORF Transcript_11307/g.30456 Transcript_11307/m.30456 type:complete len:387 (-) Transcript_11307:43-1203(-)